MIFWVDIIFRVIFGVGMIFGVEMLQENANIFFPICWSKDVEFAWFLHSQCRKKYIYVYLTSSWPNANILLEEKFANYIDL